MFFCLKTTDMKTLMKVAKSIKTFKIENPFVDMNHIILYTGSQYRNDDIPSITIDEWREMKNEWENVVIHVVSDHESVRYINKLRHCFAYFVVHENVQDLDNIKETYDTMEIIITPPVVPNKSHVILKVVEGASQTIEEVKESKNEWDNIVFHIESDAKTEKTTRIIRRHLACFYYIVHKDPKELDTVREIHKDVIEIEIDTPQPLDTNQQRLRDYAYSRKLYQNFKRIRKIMADRKIISRDFK